MADDAYSYDRDEDEPKGGDNLFLWTVFILLLIGIAFACWLGSFYIFGHPEEARPYRLLMKMKKIEAPRRFEVTLAPPGEFLSAQKLFERYSGMKQLELERENANLLRDYIKNYRETKKLVPYVTGRFNILQTYPLTENDAFSSGVVTLAQSVDFPQTLIEHVYTAPAASVPELQQMLQTGLDITLKRTDDCAAIIHIDKTPDGRLKFTVLSILYGTYALKQGSGTFSLEPPARLNLDAGFPVVKVKALSEAMRSYAEYRRQHPAAASDTSLKTGPELVRVETTEPGTSVPEKGVMPTPPVATPIPIASRATPRPIASATPAPPPTEVVMLATPRPAAVATPRPADVPPPPRMSPTGVPLQPFNQTPEVVSRPDPVMQATAGATWRTYAPGKAPPGRVVTPDDAGELADHGMITGTTYLRGSFRVTATGTNRAVLRDASKPDEQSPRIVVEYPAGAVPPGEKELFVRDSARPYLVRDVRRGVDGVVTIYVKEITQEPR